MNIDIKSNSNLDTLSLIKVTDGNFASASYEEIGSGLKTIDNYSKNEEIWILIRPEFSKDSDFSMDLWISE